MMTFRVKFHDDNGTWYEVHDIEAIVMFSQIAASKTVRFDQFTGFRDIFNGDIVELQGDLYIVSFIDGAFCLGDRPIISIVETTKVMGNVYDNPELIGE